MVASAGGHFTQSFLYNLWQTGRLNVTVKRLVFYKGDQPLLFCQILISPLWKNFKQINIPHGPIIFAKNLNHNDWNQFKKYLTKLARPLKVAFIRLETSDNIFNQFKLKEISNAGYHTVLSQPRYEWQSQISKDEDILKSLPKKTRYAIKTSLKRGVKIEIINHNLISKLDGFYALLTETARRNNFSLHPKSYYEQVLITTENENQGFLVLAYDNEDLLAINLIIKFNQTAFHIFGGSSGQKRDKLATYACHWGGFLASQEQGLTYYNFGGISRNKDKDLTWQTLTSFKKQFTGEIKDWGKLVDIPIIPFIYYLYTIRKKFNF